MRTKSDGSTKGIGIHHAFEAGRQADAELHVVPRAAASAAAMRGASSSAAQNDLVEADRAIFVELRAHLRRRAAGRVAAHHVVAHQPVDLAPVLGRIGRRQRRLVEAARRPAGCSRHDGRRAARSRSAGGSDRAARSRRAACRRCTSLRNGRPAAPGPTWSRQAFTKGGEVAAEISTPSVCRPASFSMLGREAASTIGIVRAAIDQAPALRPGTSGPGSRPSRRRTAGGRSAIASPSRRPAAWATRCRPP